MFWGEYEIQVLVDYGESELPHAPPALANLGFQDYSKPVRLVNSTAQHRATYTRVRIQSARSNFATSPTVYSPLYARAPIFTQRTPSNSSTCL